MKMLRALLALSLCLCAFAAFAEPVSFTDLARHLQYKNVKISPDGKHLAATSIVDGQTVLTLIDLAKMSGGNVKPRQGDDVIDFWWASPTRVLYAEGEHVGGYDMPFSTGEIYAVNADGGSQAILYGYRAGDMETGTHIQRVSPERGSATFLSTIDGDPDHVLIEVVPWDASGSAGVLSFVYKLDVRDGLKTRVAAAPVRELDFLADHKGHVRYAFGEDLDGSAKIYQRAAEGGDWQLLQDESAKREFPIAFNRDDSVVYFDCSDSQAFAVCSRDPASGKMTRLWSNPDVDSSSLLQGFARDSVIGVGFEDGRPGKALFDSNSPDAKALVVLMQQFPGENVRFISGTEDGAKSIVYVDADADPGQFYLYDRDAKKASLLLQRAKWINPEVMASKQPITLSARDGLKLQGYVSYPPGHEQDKHLPMVVFVHGGPYGVRDDWDYEPYVQALATRGYAVLQVNYRGSGGYGHAFEKAGWLQWGGKMQDDVTDATRWAIAQGIADPNRICIYGGSYGGYAALEGAVKEPNLYKCAIGYVGVYDLPLMYSRGDIPQDLYGKDYLKRVLGTDMTVLAQHSPIHQLGNLKAKVMLIVGGEDKRVPVAQGMDMHLAMLSHHIPHEWLYKPNEMHGFYKEDNVADLFQKVDAFLDANIGSGEPGTAAPPAQAAAAAQH